MKILFVSSEVAPFAKTGGLGDVSAALPRQLHERGHDLRVFVPLYRRVHEGNHTLRRMEEHQGLQLQLGPHRYTYGLAVGELPGSTMPVYFVDCPALYDREGIYTQDNDEHMRFLLLVYASLEACQRLAFSPDIAHANDWQAALLPLVLETRFAWDKQRFGKTKTVLTIHNMMHQGIFPADTLPDTGLADSSHLFHQEQLRAGVLNFMLTGILYATAVTTVSPTYAKEIQGEEQGAGLDAMLRERSSTVLGILNGIDETEWNPSDDPHISRTYSSETLDDKEWNKKALLESLGLPYRRHLPVVGIVSRLAWQKGLELVFEALPPLLQRGKIQFVALGSGASSYEQRLGEMQRRFPKQVCFYRGFSNPLAHMIEAGADMFLMPSRYEPCGLNQLYSMRYGTVPIVRKTGGLADSVQHVDGNTGSGTGFVFEHFSGDGLAWALGQALRIWPRRKLWRRIQQNGMHLDFSWRRQVSRYEALYHRVMEL